MSFLSPLFLFALLAIGIPLIIHLLNLKRPQKVAFSSLFFFKELQKTTIRKIKIKRYLLLLVRLLAITCLALVLARPYLPPGLIDGDSNSAALHVVLLDNSISMERIGEKGPLLEQAKSIITELEASSKDIDRFIFQTTNGEEQFTSVIGHSQLLRRFEETKISKGGNYTIQRLQSLISLLDDSPYENKRIYIISDGQLSQFTNLEQIETIPRTITTTLFNLGNVVVQNTAIISVETSSDMIGLKVPVFLDVTIQNQSDIPISNQFITLEFEQNIVGQYSVSLSPNSSQTYSFSVIPTKTGTVTGRILLEGDEFVSDNVEYFSIQVPERRNVLWVSSPEQIIKDISYTELILEASNQDEAQLNYTKIEIGEFESITIEEYESIIFEGLRTIPEFALERLEKFVQNGGGIILFPSEQFDIKSYNEFLKRYNAGIFNGIVGDYASLKPIASANNIEVDHPIFDDLFERDENEQIRVTRPDIYYYYRFQPSTSPGGLNIITLNNGDPLIREKRFGDGRIIISAIGNDSGWSNFGVKPLYAPFYYRALLYATSTADGGLAEHTLGQKFSWIGKISSTDLVLEKGDAEIIPETRSSSQGVELTYPAIDWEPGFVVIRNEKDELKIAVNMDKSESEFVSIDENIFMQNELEARIVNTAELQKQALTNEIIASGFGREIWQWFMWAGLCFLILESLISAYYKTETFNL